MIIFGHANYRDWETVLLKLPERVRRDFLMKLLEALFASRNLTFSLGLQVISERGSSACRRSGVEPLSFTGATLIALDVKQKKILIFLTVRPIFLNHLQTMFPVF